MNRLLPGFPEERYSVLQCCGAAVGKGKEGRRFEGGGGRQNVKVQNPNDIRELVGWFH